MKRNRRFLDPGDGTRDSLLSSRLFDEPKVLTDNQRTHNADLIATATGGSHGMYYSL